MSSTIEEGRAAAYMGGKPSDNPYRRAQRHAKTDEEYARLVPLRNDWDSGFAGVPRAKQGTVK